MLLYFNLLIFFSIFNFSYSLDKIEDKNQYYYEVRHIRENDTLEYELTLNHYDKESNEEANWEWTLNYTEMVDSQKRMIIQTVSFDPIIDLRDIVPKEELSNLDLSMFKAYQITFPPLVDIKDLDKKLLEPRVVLPLFITSHKSKILKRPKEASEKRTIIRPNTDKDEAPSYETKTTQYDIDKTEVAECTYTVVEQSKFSNNDKAIDVWVINCECVEFNESQFVNKAKYYYNEELGFVYYYIVLEKDRIEIRLKE